jgi:hypothetical protein
MNRKLLPYEYQLIEALGVTEDEYIDFLSAQLDYSLSEQERNSVVRAEPVLIVSAVLTVIGTIFQVVGSIIAANADQPRARDGRRQRQERFSPRYGFNSSQDLAQYGDPVNLIYCSTRDNELGGVRAGLSLVWSAIESYGSSQFMQLLFVVGAAKVRTLDESRFAFGQLSLRQILASKLWIYYDRNGNTKYDDRVLGDGRDPTRLEGTPKEDDVCKIIDGGQRKEGYSQAFSPSSANVFGVFSPIPINVDIQERKSSGKIKSARLGIKIKGESWQTGSDSKWKVGDRFTLVFEEIEKKKDNIAQEAAKDIRYQMVGSLDVSSTYKLGTAKFRMLSISDSINLDKNNVDAVFECIEAGRSPYTGYGKEKAWKFDDKDREKLEEYESILESPYEEAVDPRVGGTLEGGNRLYLEYLDRDEYKYDRLRTDGFEFSFLGVSYDFKGTDVIKWKTDVQDRDSEDFKRDEYEVDRGGSIAYTKRLYKDFLANKPTISTKKLRRSYESDLEDLRDLRDEINAGDHDKELRDQAKENTFVKAIKKQIEELQELAEEITGEIYGFQKNKNNDGLLKASGTDLTTKKDKKLAKIEKQIDKLKDDKEDILTGEIAQKRKAAIRTIRNARTHFRLYGKTFSGGIRYVKDKLSDLKGENTTDKTGVKEVRRYFRALIQAKEEALNFLRYVTKEWEMIAGQADDHFYTKCLVKAEEAVYQTVTSCDYVKFAIRCRIFRNIGGRAKRYGEKRAPDGFKNSDNGYKGRIAMFKLEYKKSRPNSEWKLVPLIFAVRRGADQDNFIALNFRAENESKWEFKLEPINDMGAEIKQNGYRKFAFIENSGKRDSFNHDGNRFWFTGSLVDVNESAARPDQPDRGPVMMNEWDLFSTRSDSQLTGSFSGGPEFTIAAVTEQQLGNTDGKYKEMSMLALGVYSGLGMQDLRAVTAYVTEGKECYRINEDTGAYSKGERSSSYAPDIFADTVLDRLNGIGKYARPEAIDWKSLALAKRFCKSNGLGTDLYMDGVISERTSWREFWTNAATYSLLEFARIGGRETLIPAVPVNSDGRATRAINVSALFNQGNILQDSYREEFLDYGTETQNIIATVIYRETEIDDVFPRNASVSVSVKGISEDESVRQTFDLSQFVTRRKQAILFGKLACNQRRYVRKAIEFKTIPTDSPVSPGSYIIVDIGLNTWDEMTSGVVLPGGALSIPLNDKIAAGSYSMLLYKAGSPTITLENVSIDANLVAQQAAEYAGRLFVLGKVIENRRVFRVNEVQMDEEGEVTIKATNYPCDNDGTRLLSRVANFSDDEFEVV